MKKILFILLYSLYIAFVLGLIFHTSTKPQVFGKYTVRYAIVLLLLIAEFFPFLWLSRFLIYSEKVRLLGKKISFSPFRKIMFAIVILILIVAPFELYLRNKYRNYESDNYQYTLENFHPFLQSRIAKHEKLTVNSLGFRNKEVSAVKPKGAFRIFVLGGSSVLNREVIFEKNTVRLLEKKLQFYYPNKKIEVINAGKDYYTSEHSLIQYMYKIADLDPDLVVMWHGVNDMLISCLLEGTVTYGAYKSDYSHSFGAVSKIIFDHFRPKPLIQIKLVSLDFFLKNLSDNLYSDFTNTIRESVRKRAAREYLENKNTVEVREFPSITAYRRNLEYLVELTSSGNIPLIFGNQPSLFRSQNSVVEVKAIMFPTIACKKKNKNYSLASYKYGLNLFNSETERIAKANNIMFIDLDSAVPKNLEYFVDMVHYTEKGNERIANVLFDFIILNQLIK